MAPGAALGIAALVLVTALAPPGLCPCWLLRDVAVIHPHLMDTLPDHYHDYLLDFTAMGDAAVAGVPVPLGALLTALTAAALWRKTEDPTLDALSWSPLPLFPPPKQAG
jgi:hypothetical protein